MAYSNIFFTRFFVIFPKLISSTQRHPCLDLFTQNSITYCSTELTIANIIPCPQQDNKILVFQSKNLFMQWCSWFPLLQLIFIICYSQALSANLKIICNMYSCNKPAVVIDGVLQTVPVKVSYSLISSD